MTPPLAPALAEGSTRPGAGARRAGRVTLVGGGPGDPGLITVEGLRRLRAAEVVVTDRLGPIGLLDDLDPDVEVIDVGKTPGNHPVPQEEINRILVEQALAGREVVRLKGGDPFVLGRGGEEVAACRAAGVRVDVVPGVTSAFSVPAAAGIPVTHRGLSRSVTVMSGHDALDEARMAQVACAGGTLVVLMGVALVGRLTAGLLAAGLDPDLPAAVVEQGWTPQQRTTCATLGTLAALAHERGVRAPAVLVIGAVAALAGEETALGEPAPGQGALGAAVGALAFVAGDVV